jgi:CRP-like cAMP-binding protein
MYALATRPAVESTQRVSNGLLSSLPSDIYQSLTKHMAPVDLSFDQVLYEAGEKVEYVYFPNNTVVSLLGFIDDGTTVEVGMVGRGGMVGIEVILGSIISPHWTTAQIPGKALRMRSSVLLELSRSYPLLNRALQDQYRSLINQFCQRSVCNSKHMLLQRLSTWLLMVSNRAGSATLPLTQDHISQRLGTRRASVTTVYSTLQKMGIINYKRGHTTILDREKLELTACECFSIIEKREY